MRNNNSFSLKQVVYFFIAGVLALSLIKIMGIDPTNPGSWKEEFTELGAKAENFFKDPKIGNGSSNGGNSSSNNTGNDENSDSGDNDDSSSDNNASSTDIQEKLNSLTVAAPADVNYDRGEWRHWDGYGRSCWNIREETLYRQNSGDIILLDKDKNITTNKDDACYISTGVWEDPYTGETFTNASDLDIDHMIPLGYAARQGGQAWTKEEKSEYANSLNDNHLIAVSASANRSKSDRGPSEWKPIESYQCQYATDWVNISELWELSVPEEDVKALREMLSTC